MQDIIIKLFRCYLSNDFDIVDINNNEISNIKNIDFFIYHKIDMLFYDVLKKFNYEKLSKKRKKIKIINKKYSEIAKQLSNELVKNNIPHVFLKGLSCIKNIYKCQWHRYFNDIDLLIEKKYVDKVEKILIQFGYIYANESYDKKSLIPASRSDILFQKAFTHEIHNMARIEDGGWISNIDVNFLFSWNGLDKNNLISITEFKDHIIDIDGIYFFDDLVNMLHMCCHLYNEAVYFALDKDFAREDPKEIQLNKIFDIAILAHRLDVSDFNELYILSKRYGFSDKIKYAIALVNNILKTDIPIIDDELINKPSIDFDYYYTKENKLAKWPISVLERVFDLEKKKCIIEEVFS